MRLSVSIIGGWIAILISVPPAYSFADAIAPGLSMRAQIPTPRGTSQLNQNAASLPAPTRGSVTRQIAASGNRYESIDYTFQGAVGEWLFVEIRTDGVEAEIFLIGPNNVIVATTSTEETRASFAVLTADLPTYGEYQVVVRTLEAGITGSYDLSWSLIHNVAAAQSAGGISPASIPSASMSGQLNEQSSTLDNGSYYNTYTLEGTENEALIIEMISDQVDADLILIGPDSSIITRNNDGGEGANAKIVAVLPTTGTYQIIASSHRPRQSGSYVLSWRSPSPEELAQIQLPAEIPAYAYPQYQRFLDSLGFLPSDRIDQTLLQDGWVAAALMFEENITVLRQQLGDRHPDVAEQLYYLATIYNMQGRSSEAEPLLAEALAIYRESPGNHPAETALVLSILGGIVYEQGQVDQAESLYQEALAILSEDAGDREDLIPTIQLQLAFLRDARTQANRIAAYETAAYETATDGSVQHHATEIEALLVQAISTARQDSEPFELANQIDILGNLYHRQGRYSEAESLYLEAAELRRRLDYSDHRLVYGGQQHPSLATSFNNLALLYQTQGRYAEAEDLYQQALAVYDAYIGWVSTQGDSGYTTPERQNFAENQRTSMIPMYFNLASLYRLTNNIPAAIAHLRTGLDLEERDLDIVLANAGESNRIAYMAGLSNTLNYVLSLHLDSAPNSSEAAQLALTTLLRRKGRVLEAGLRTQEVLRHRAEPEDLALLDQLAQLRQEIANLTAQPLNTLSAAEQRTRLAQLTSQLNQLETRLARRSAALALDSQTVEIAAVQAQIPDSAVLIEYARYSPFDPTNPASDRFGSANPTVPASDRFAAPRYVAYLLFPNGRIQAVDLGDADQIDGAVQAFIQQLQLPHVPFQSTRELESLLVDPITPYLQGIDHLLVSPDGQLNLLPFEALQTETGADYLVQRYQISYLNSGRDLLRFGTVQPSRNPAVIVANPDYETAAPTLLASQSSGDQQRAASISQLRFSPLPGTATELEAIRPLLTNPIVLDQQAATETALKQVESPQILHIATHGVFLANVDRTGLATRGIGVVFDDTSLAMTGTGTAPETDLRVTVENPLLRSGLALAGFNTRSSSTRSSDDGILTALEASQLNLTGTQLVVLSACDTGLGDIANGEGVYGLRRAFAIAGAETQLLSLWQVSDFGTQSLMARYYEKLTAGMGRSEALRAAQLDMLAEAGNYSHPYYWAAFVMAGDWRPLQR